MRKSLKVGLAATALLAGMSAAAEAQGSASVNATARVLQAISVSAGGAIDFGQVVVGTSKTVTPDLGGAFQVTGTEGAAITYTWTLPADLGDPGVTLGTWDGLRNTVNATAGAGSIAPVDGVGVADVLPGAGNAASSLYFWIGATVTVAGGVAPGTYTAPVTLSVVYN